MSTSNCEDNPITERIKKYEHVVLSATNDYEWTLEKLIDLLIVLYDECCHSSLRSSKNVLDFINRVKPFAKKIKDTHLHRDDFEFLKVIGKGAFGEVALVRMKLNQQIFALKTLSKYEMLRRAETACFREERDVLVKGHKEWITRLHYAFQDEINLVIYSFYCFHAAIS
jgi:serine/threonine-protein kinase MRCK